MNRRYFIQSTLAATLCIGKTAGAGTHTLNDLTQYLNQLKSMTAKFQQRGHDGLKSKGNFYLKHPGRARFDYGDKNGSRVIIASHAVNVFDGRSNSVAQVYPTFKTPLQHILKNKVDLEKSGSVIGLRESKGQINLSLHDKRRPEAGTLHLHFSSAPIQLIGWIAVTQSGEKIRVKLSSINENSPIKSHLFRV